MTASGSVRDRRFGGVGVALVTPLDAGGTLVEHALDGIMNRVLDGGADYVVCGGTSGEGPFVPAPTRRAMIEQAVARVDGRVPVVAGVITDSLHDARAQVRELADTGLSGLMLTPPYYYPLNDDELRRFYTEVAEITTLPLILYNIPQNARNALGPALVARLAEIPSIVAIKDSGARDFATHVDIIDAVADRTDFTVLTGLDRLLLPSLLMGGHGTISPSGNVLPGAAVSVLAAFERGDLAEAHRAQRHLAAALAAVQVGRFPGWWKTAVPETASAGGFAAELAPQGTGEERAAIAERIRAALAAHPPVDARIG